MMLFPYMKEPATGSLIPSISTGGAAMNAMMKQVVAASDKQVISRSQASHKQVIGKPQATQATRIIGLLSQPKTCAGFYED